MTLRALSVTLVAFCVTACQTTKPIVLPPDTIRVPVPSACLPATLPVKPQIHTDDELAALDDYKLPLAIFRDRRALIDYSGELEAVLSACR